MKKVVFEKGSIAWQNTAVEAFSRPSAPAVGVLALMFYTESSASLKSDP